MEATDSSDYEESRVAQAERIPVFRIPSFRSSEPSSPPVQTPRDTGASLYEAVFVKENVSIHPSQGSNAQIAGRLRLVKQTPSLFMTWIPYVVAGVSAQDRNLYTIRAVAVNEIRSLRRHAPALGHHHITIVLTSGLAYPPLVFHKGGVADFLTVLKDYALLVRSLDDPNVFLVNDVEDPLQSSLTQLDLSGMGNGEHVASPPMSPSLHTKDPVTPRTPGGGVFNKFSFFPKFGRNPSSLLFPPGEEGGRREEDSIAFVPTRSTSRKVWVGGRPQEPLVEDEVGSFEMVDHHPEALAPALVWKRDRPPPLTKEEWGGWMDSEGRVNDEPGLRRRVFYGGCTPEVRREVWKVLLGYWPPNTTHIDREESSDERSEEYAVLKRQWMTISDHQALRFTLFRERRSMVEKDVVRTDRVQAFYEGEGNGNVDLLRSILITYSFYNFDLGYCQGMSDLVAPILSVMGDEGEAFWAFACLMERMAPNFCLDQSGMRAQLLALGKLVQLLDPPLHDYLASVDCLNFFFCFRWILIHFKREFGYEDCMRLWEVLWTRYLSDHFHLYVCLAILKRHRRKIMDELMEFDSLLKFTNDMSGRIDLEATLRDAEALCVYAGSAGLACMPQSATESEDGFSSPLHKERGDNAPS